MRKVVTRTIPTGQELDETRARLRAQLADVQGELDRLVEGLARSGVSPAVTAAIRRREARKADLDRELAGLDQCEQLSHVELSRLEGLARGKAAEWRTVAASAHTPGSSDSLEGAA